jgi:hypothetical protein
MDQEELNADPQQLLAQAEKEPSRRGLEEYADTIRVLKEDKGFSYREIAAWFQQRGLNVDHNAVWRTYSRTLPRSTGSAMDEHIEQSEQSPPPEDAKLWL